MIPMFKVYMSSEAILEASLTLHSGMIGEGNKVVEFKKKLEEFFNCNNVILLNSCTSALTLALRLCDIKPGDEVISTPFTMIATNVTIMTTGAKIVWADIEPDTFNISYEDIKKKITNKTKAIVLTHVGGMPCDMEEIGKLGIPIIADCAHAVGSYYKGEHISHWAEYSCFSFQSIKHLTTGDGGCIVIRDKDKYELAEKLKWFGMTRKVPEGKTKLEHQMEADVEEWGYKFHMNDIAASIGLKNIEHLPAILRRHKENAEYYCGKLGININKEKESSWWLFPILSYNRKELILKMNNAGIEVSPMWRRNDEYSTFSEFRGQKLSNMDFIQDKILFIPVGWWLTTEQELDKIMYLLVED
jgi:perosamine synthetase